MGTSVPFPFTINSITMGKPKRHFNEDSVWHDVLGFLICVGIVAFFLVSMIVL